VKKKILIIENFAEDFEKSRMSYALYLINNNYEVYTLLPEKADIVKNPKINYIAYDLNRNDKGLYQLIKLSFKINHFINYYGIEIIHSFRFQPNILNVLANMFSKKQVVIHITGLGISFSKRSFKYLFLRSLTVCIYNLLFIRANNIITQNDEDFIDLDLLNLFNKKNEVIYGSGVDTDYFNIYNPDIESIEKRIYNGKTLFLFASRLIYQKGLVDLIKSFNLAYEQNKNIHLIIIGWIDNDNPDSFKKHEIDEFDKLPFISFLGKTSKMLDYYNLVDVFVLPSKYREGIPRVLLEALSMSLPVITTNTPGCKLTVNQTFNGELVVAGGIVEMSTAIMKMAKNEGLLSDMGSHSRNLALNKFSTRIIYKQFKDCYE